jgi:hypothetical protein
MSKACVLRCATVQGSSVARWKKERKICAKATILPFHDSPLVKKSTGDIDAL